VYGARMAKSDVVGVVLTVIDITGEELPAKELVP
jgi:hypothetical protein